MKYELRSRKYEVNVLLFLLLSKSPECMRIDTFSVRSALHFSKRGVE